jgi:hypothetical protein
LACGLVNLGSCLPQKFFEFMFNIINAPIQPFLNLTLNLLSEPINIELFLSMWVIIVYLISMFYGLMLVASGFNFIISGYDVVKRENAKKWLRNIIVMIILIQASFFIYQLAIDLSSIMTSATLTLVDSDFFLISVDDIGDIGLGIMFALIYVLTLLVTALILVIRYAFVAVGVVLLPLAIFFYFLPPLKSYGSLILNFLGIAIFITFFDVILLAGFSKLVDLAIFNNMEILVLVSAFMTINVLMLLLLLFSVVKAGLSIYSDVKKVVSLF